MNLPVCPNFKQRVCERSALRLVGENEKVFLFTCATCSLLWAVTKDKTKAQGRYEAQLRRVKEASEQERTHAGLRRYSFASR